MWRRAPRTPRRILIVNPFGIGDVLFTTPLVRAIRQAFPDSRLGYLCNRRTERVLRDNPHLSRLFVYEKDELVTRWRHSKREGAHQFRELLSQVRRAGFDFVIDLSLSERYSFFLRGMGIRRLAGFNFRRRGRFLSDALPIDGYQGDHVVEHYRRLLAFLGIRLCDASLELPVAAEDEAWVDEWLMRHGLGAHDTLIGLVPAGGVSWGINALFRRWSDEGFAAVGDALARRPDVRILLFGEASDRGACRAVAQRMAHPALDVSGETTLGQFISFLGRLELVVCNDGGPLHLAVSRGVKTVSVFGPVDPRVYGPYDPGHSGRHQVVYRQELPCRPCYHQFKLPPCPYDRACLAWVEPADVVRACERLLSRPAIVVPA